MSLFSKDRLWDKSTGYPPLANKVPPVPEPPTPPNTVDKEDVDKGDTECYEGECSAKWPIATSNREEDFETEVLWQCDKCGDYFTTTLDGLWNIDELLKNKPNDTTTAG